MNRDQGNPDKAPSTSTGVLRADLLRIADMVAPDSRVLDIGCGNGELLAYLERERGADARGVEISQAGVNVCVARGLSVIQGDADTDLNDYPSGAFDYVILSQTLQATHNPREVLRQLLRIGRRAIVSFPNFGHWRVRLQLLLRGRMPDTGTLDTPWYRTPNIHLCTIHDFVVLCDSLGIAIERWQALGARGRPLSVLQSSLTGANLFGAHGLFLLKRARPE